MRTIFIGNEIVYVSHNISCARSISIICRIYSIKALPLNLIKVLRTLVIKMFNTNIILNVCIIFLN